MKGVGSREAALVVRCTTPHYLPITLMVTDTNPEGDHPSMPRTTPPQCRCYRCGTCYYDHHGYVHEWVNPHDAEVPLVELRLPPGTGVPMGLVEAERAPILVDTATAAFAAGREEKVIYRWANEGRLTRHGGVGKGNARWDLREIPAWDGPDSGKPRPAPPSVKPKNFQDRA